MKVVIDIGKADYKLLMKGGVVKKYLTKDHILATLPKGHGRLVDESEVVSINESNDKVWCEAPTIIEADKGE